GRSAQGPARLGRRRARRGRRRQGASRRRRHEGFDGTYLGGGADPQRRGAGRRQRRRKTGLRASGRKPSRSPGRRAGIGQGTYRGIIALKGKSARTPRKTVTAR